MKVCTTWRAARAGALALVFASAACSSQSRVHGPRPDQTALIVFSNESTEQAAVYAVAGSQQQRIGTVFSLQRMTLKVPSTMLATGTVTIVARLLARNEMPASGSFAVRPGSRWEVRLSPDRRTMSVLPGAQQ